MSDGVGKVGNIALQWPETEAAMVLGSCPRNRCEPPELFCMENMFVVPVEKGD